MLSPDSTKGARTRKTRTVPRTMTLRRPFGRTLKLAPSLRADSARSASSRTGDRWIVALGIVGLGALAAALVVYVFYPALHTLADASVATWTGEVP